MPVPQTSPGSVPAAGAVYPRTRPLFLRLPNKMKIKELSHLLYHCADAGADSALGLTTQSDHLNAQEAYHLYGRSQVDRWIKEGLVTKFVRANARHGVFDRKQLADVAGRSNRQTYLTAAERA